MANNRFQSGWAGQSGCYSCAICQRKTRATGQASRHLCKFCDEWTMTENGLSDDRDILTAEEKAQMEAYILENKLAAAKRGGNREALGL